MTIQRDSLSLSFPILLSICHLPEKRGEFLSISKWAGIISVAAKLSFLVRIRLARRPWRSENRRDALTDEPAGNRKPPDHRMYSGLR